MKLGNLIEKITTITGIKYKKRLKSISDKIHIANGAKKL